MHTGPPELGPPSYATLRFVFGHKSNSNQRSTPPQPHHLSVLLGAFQTQLLAITLSSKYCQQCFQQKWPCFERLVVAARRHTTLQDLWQKLNTNKQVCKGGIPNFWVVLVTLHSPILDSGRTILVVRRMSLESKRTQVELSNPEITKVNRTRKRVDHKINLWEHFP